ncbi:hypothetical protein Tco_0388905 [Tanacetum coccineum]
MSKAATKATMKVVVEVIAKATTQAVMKSTTEAMVTDIHKKTKTRQKPNKTEHEIGKGVENRSKKHMHLSGPYNGYPIKGQK